MLVYMLDTDIASYVIKTRTKELADKFIAESGRIALSEITLAELRFGATNHPTQPGYHHNLIDELTSRLEVIPWSASAHYGELRFHLKKNRLDPMDLLIASHALQQSLTLVTNNEKHFQRVPELRIENWTK